MLLQTHIARRIYGVKYLANSILSLESAGVPLHVTARRWTPLHAHDTDVFCSQQCKGIRTQLPTGGETRKVTHMASRREGT